MDFSGWCLVMVNQETSLQALQYSGREMEMAQTKGTGSVDPEKGQIAKPFNSPPPPKKIIFKLRTNKGDFKVIIRFLCQNNIELISWSACIQIWALFLICYLNRFKLFSGKQLSLGGGSFAYLIIRYAFPAHCLSGNSIFCETSDGW